VQGVPVEGRIVNLRRVQWTSFQPNFFIEFQPGVLDDAPKSLIAAVSSLPKDSKLAIQKDLALSFPNVTVIDVTQVMERLLATAGQMSLALKTMAFLTLIAGFGVLLAIARTESAKRRPDIVLLKALGMGFFRVRVTTACEFALLGFISAFIGAGLSVLGAMIFTRELFDSIGILNFGMPATIAGVVTMLCVATGLTATEGVLRTEAQRALSTKQWGA
jgi:putative ABC transport system permease protein